MKLITFKTDKSGITIRIPRTLLNHVAKNHPEYPVKIYDSRGFMEKVSFELEHNLDEQDMGITGFNELLDKAIEAVVESGDPCCDYKEEDEY